MTRTSFGDQLQQIWQTRPVRLPRGPIAGVAAGFGERYNVDPVLVRVAFVVSTIFGGAGVVLYLLAWLMLHQAGDQASAAESLVGKGHSSQSQTKTIVLVVALAIAVSTMGPLGVGLGGGGLISMGLMLGGWWMLHMRQPAPPLGAFDSYGLVPDSGISATGYPGAVFPTGSPLRTNPGNLYTPEGSPTNMYTPYTKLPDAYVPDKPVEPLSAENGDAPTELIDRDTGYNSTPADAETVLLDKSGAPDGGATTVLDAETVLLDKNTGAASRPSTDHTATQHDAGDTANPVSGEPLSLGKDTADSKTPGPGESASGPGTSVLPRPDFDVRTPPSWDPLGVAPLAWDLPEPTPTRTVVAPEPKRPRSRLTPVVLGLAILAAAGAGAAAAAGVEWMTPARIGAAALAVIGLGLILGAFMRRGFGLLIVTAPLAGFVLLASIVGPIDFNRGAMGDEGWKPVALTEPTTSYEISMGTATLDLRSLAPLTESRTVELSVTMGDARVLLPENLTVRTECTVTLGDASCPTGITGPNTPGKPVLDLKVDVSLGNVEVTRG